MAQNYQKIGDYISVLDNRNADGSITNLMGISIDKCYIPSVANVIGTDLNNYKVIRKGQFACSLMQVSRDQRIPLAMYTSDEPAIMSPAYVMFEVNRPDELLPEYMELWFKRAEFDREASFYAVGGVRGSLDWEDFCKMKLPVPPISEQRKIVHDYQVITDRIGVLRKMNNVLLAIVMQTYQRFISSSTCQLMKIEDIAERIAMGPFGSNIKVETFVSDGVPIISGNHLRGFFLEEQTGFNHITQEHADKLKNSIVKQGDIIFTHAGNIGQVALIQEKTKYELYVLSQRQFYLRCNNNVLPLFVTCFFHSADGQRKLLSYANSTGVPSLSQPATNLRKIELLIPSIVEQKEWQREIQPIVNLFLSNQVELEHLLTLASIILSNIVGKERIPTKGA